MPKFYASEDINVEPDEFYDSCSDSEKLELLEFLRDDGYIPAVRTETSPKLTVRKSAPELIFEENLLSLRNKFHQLTHEEERIIVEIAKKYS